MRYRIAKKKLKKNCLLNLWVKSSSDWWYSNKKQQKLAYDDFWECFGIAAKFILYDLEKIYLIGKKMGIKEKMLKRYRDEIISKIKNNESQYDKH